METLDLYRDGGSIRFRRCSSSISVTVQEYRSKFIQFCSEDPKKNICNVLNFISCSDPNSSFFVIAHRYERFLELLNHVFSFRSLRGYPQGEMVAS